jgi:hypothetical protein
MGVLHEYGLFGVTRDGAVATLLYVLGASGGSAGAAMAMGCVGVGVCVLGGGGGIAVPIWAAARHCCACERPA